MGLLLFITILASYNLPVEWQVWLVALWLFYCFVHDCGDT
jgi:hypothetical protein